MTSTSLFTKMSLKEFSTLYFSSHLSRSKSTNDEQFFPVCYSIKLVDVPFIFYKNTLYSDFSLAFDQDSTFLMRISPFPLKEGTTSNDFVFSPSLVSVASSKGTTLASFDTDPSSYSCLLSDSFSINSRLLSEHFTRLDKEKTALTEEEELISQSLEEAIHLSESCALLYQRYAQSPLFSPSRNSNV